MRIITPTTAPTALRTVPRARRTTPLRVATSGAIPRATGETRPAWIVTGGRGWAGRADTQRRLAQASTEPVGFPPLGAMEPNGAFTVIREMARQEEREDAVRRRTP